MKIPDVNILIYSRDSSSRHSAQSRAWIEKGLSGAETIGFPIVALLGFVRLTTNPRVFDKPLTAGETFDQIDEWLEQPPAVVVHPGGGHLTLLRGLLESSGTAGNLTTDAHLAAIAIEHGATLASFDGDLHRFPGLKLEYMK